MTFHVDIIETDWGARREVLAARLSLDGENNVLVEATDDEPKWRRVLFRPRVDAAGVEHSPIKDGEAFLELLVDQAASGSYMHAVRHEFHDPCPFKQVGDAVRAKTIGVR